MFDFVANHISSRSPWFPGWLAGTRRTTATSSSRAPTSTSRTWCGRAPRRSFHAYARPDGTIGVGVDHVRRGPGRRRRPSTPAALLELTDVLLGYLAHGASTVRLDAIGFLWKESGTTCLHLPQTHAIISSGGPWSTTSRPARGCSPRPTSRTPRTSPTSATATTRRTSSTSSRCRRWCCTRSSPATRDGARRLGRRHRAGQRRPPPGSTSWPATTASACAPPRAS